MTNTRIFAAPVDQKTYYLDNAKCVWRWVLEYHRDLLTLVEAGQLEGIFQLNDNAQALLTRLVMRRGTLFERNVLSYTEIDQIDKALLTLIEQGYVSADPIISFEALCDKATKQQLVHAISHHNGIAAAKSASKSTLQNTLAQTLSDLSQRRISDWGLPGHWIQLNHRPLYQRVQLMFFGNLHQDWSEFIITELGHVRYESVTLSTESRAFQARQDVDDYLWLHNINETLKSAPLDVTTLPSLAHRFTNIWVEKRRQRLAFQVAQQLEKESELSTACQYYRAIGGNAANVRFLRLQERLAPPEQVAYEAVLLLNHTTHSETRVLIERVLHRSYRKLNFRLPPKRPFQPREIPLVLPQSTVRIESAVREHLSTHAPQHEIYYVENHLIPALWALLYWDVLYAPIQGAFFHPFQAAPKDLYSPNFFARRRPHVDQVARLLDDKRYADIILERFTRKHGISCPFIYWPALSQSLLETALRCIPKDDLVSMFDYLMSDLKHHKKGLPDLIRFDPQEQRYDLIEVKGPTDRLQEQQTLWLEHFHRHGIEAWVAKVSWQL